MVYLVGRYCDPQTEQFLSVDPMLKETQDAYRYAGDDPVSRTDPNGMFNVGFASHGCGGPGMKACPTPQGACVFSAIDMIGHHWRGIAQVGKYLGAVVLICTCSVTLDGPCVYSRPPEPSSRGAQ